MLENVKKLNKINTAFVLLLSVAVITIAISMIFDTSPTAKSKSWGYRVQVLVETIKVELAEIKER